MKKLFTATALILTSIVVWSQGITLPASGGNQKSTVTQGIGPVQVSINYSSPNVHGPNNQDRKGHIWGELVPYGLNNLGFGTSTAAPWRAGANENTIITFSHDVKVNGKDLRAGTYGLHVIVEKDKPWTVIFSNNSSSWGSFFYDAGEDALRVEATAEDCEYTEHLTYGFDTRGPSSARAFLKWENKKLPFNIEVPDVNQLYIATIRNELRNSPGFNFQNWAGAAQFCATNKINLEEALTWAESAISSPFIGQENFNTLQTKANVLTAMGKEGDADAIMEKAITHPTANVGQIHQYARTLVTAGKQEKALEVFKLNSKLHPEDKFTPNVGLARGYTALGDKKNAIKFWELALANLPENQKANQTFYEGELKKVKEM
jgi:hypothetical protein